MTRTKSKDSLTTFCTIEGCGKPRRAKMLCVSHYNVEYRKPNPTAQFVCPSCGATFTAERARAKRYGTLYCSQACMGLGFSGKGPHCDLPDDHWARWYGATSTWTPPPVVRNTGACEWCGLPNERTALASFCSYACKKAQYKATRRGRIHHAVGTYTYRQVMGLWQAFGKRCAYCRERVMLADIQAEHVIPLSKGGENHLGNLLPSCMPCNADKRDLLLSEWSVDRTRRNLPVVVTEWDDGDPLYSHLTRTPLRMSA